MLTGAKEIPPFGLLINAILFALGAGWCYAVFKRWRSDLEELREVKDIVRKVVILGIWAVTVVIAILVVNFAGGVIGKIASGIGGLI